MRPSPASLLNALPIAAARAWAVAAGVSVRRQALNEWYGTPIHLATLRRPRAVGLGVAPRDFRPVANSAGEAILAGIFPLTGAVLETGAGGDPWNRPSPSRAFAVALHRFGWLADLAAIGDSGAREALRLTLEWQRIFGRWNAFAWSADILERRVFNLACGLKRISAGASDAEQAALAQSLAIQARHLSRLPRDAARTAERCAAVAMAGAALAGRAGERLLLSALARLESVLPQAVLPDGGHVTRSPEAALQLLFDLLAVDDALLQLGREPPVELARALDRLTGALRFFTLPDGRLACVQGGEESDPALIDAARAHDDRAETAAPSSSAPHSGFEKIIGGSFHILVDAAPPAHGAASASACAHPLALEILCGKDRLVTNTGWSPRAVGAQSLRLTPGGSTATVSVASAGAPLQGFRADVLGARLEGGASTVDVRRHQAEEGVWLEMSHDGWASAFGLTHERRLFLDIANDELRGEDRFVARAHGVRRSLPFTVRFHLHPNVKVSLARDQRRVLIQGPTAGGWWLRNDAREVSIEPSVHLADGRARRTAQVVLHSQVDGDRGGRIRWKLARVGPE